MSREGKREREIEMEREKKSERERASVGQPTAMHTRAFRQPPAAPHLLRRLRPPRAALSPPALAAARLAVRARRPLRVLPAAVPARPAAAAAVPFPPVRVAAAGCIVDSNETRNALP